MRSTYVTTCDFVLSPYHASLMERRCFIHLGQTSHLASTSLPSQEHDASADPKVASLLRRQSFTALKERILTCLVHNTTVPGGIR